jgi:RNA-directed DNA polymerase
MSISLAALADDTLLERAFAWLCRQRKDWPAASDVWDLRARWPAAKAELQAELRVGQFRFGLLSRVSLPTGDEVDLWSARDVLVLKALAWVLGARLSMSRRCVHVKGHGGAKAAVRQLLAHLPQHRFVLKTDVKSYYASIDHVLLHEELSKHIQDKGVLRVLWQYMRRCAERGGLFYDIERGISLGCPLSPLMGALFLQTLDDRMEQLGVFYLRYMDDIVVLAPSRWKLRKAARVVNQTLNGLGLEKRSEKTFVGRIERGLDFLGYHLRPEGLRVAQATLEKFIARATQLYEQGPGEGEAAARLGQYVQRWGKWARAGLDWWTSSPVGLRARCPGRTGELINGFTELRGLPP